MKISKSKQELARIISEHGGWRDGAGWATQDRVVAFFSGGKPKYETYDKTWCANGDGGVFIVAMSTGDKIKGFHNTILSRAEYFHLYPAPDADGWIEWGGGGCPVDEYCMVDYRMSATPYGYHLTNQARNLAWDGVEKPYCIIAYRPHKPEQSKSKFCESVMRSIPEPEYKPSIEQLMQVCADRANSLQLANEHLATCTKQANEAMNALSAACKANGFDVSPITAKQEPELVISDWRDLQVGDVVVITGSENSAWERIRDLEMVVVSVGETYGHLEFKSECGEEWTHSGNSEFKFIRRP